jgi:hypothetical protein
VALNTITITHTNVGLCGIGSVIAKWCRFIDKKEKWGYQNGNQNPQIEGQTIEWPKEKGEKDKQ